MCDGLSDCPYDLAVRTLKPEFCTDRSFCLNAGIPFFEHTILVVGVDRRRPALPGCLADGEPGHFFIGFIYVFAIALRIGHENTDRRCAREEPETFLAFPDSFFGFASPGDNDHRALDRCAILPVHEAHGNMNPDPAAVFPEPGKFVIVVDFHPRKPCQPVAAPLFARFRRDEVQDR